MSTVRFKLDYHSLVVNTKTAPQLLLKAKVSVCRFQFNLEKKAWRQWSPGFGRSKEIDISIRVTKKLTIFGLVSLFAPPFCFLYECSATVEGFDAQHGAWKLSLMPKDVQTHCKSRSRTRGRPVLWRLNSLDASFSHIPADIKAVSTYTRLVAGIAAYSLCSGVVLLTLSWHDI